MNIASKIDVKIEYTESDNLFIRVLDNGRGWMKALSSSMQLGHEKSQMILTRNLWHRNKIIRFGPSNQVTVLSTSQKVAIEELMQITFSISKIKFTQQVQLNHLFQVWMLWLMSWSTMVLLRRDHVRDGEHNIDEDVALQKQIDKIRIHLDSIS